jgi:hypothetical protein
MLVKVIAWGENGLALVATHGTLEANRKRSEAAKGREREADGTLKADPVIRQSVGPLDDHTPPSTNAAAALSNTNAGAVALVGGQSVRAPDSKDPQRKASAALSNTITGRARVRHGVNQAWRPPYLRLVAGLPYDRGNRGVGRG